jgi:16S rRNA C967 or C1407 C5-methylase (RsmB/RsmF family)
MGNTGLIIANELFPDRHVAMGNTLSRLGVLNTIVCAYQAQEFPLKMKHDFILADVPCSGEGRFRRDPKRPEQGHRVYPKHLQKLRQTQPRILLRGFDLLKTGGELLYATCTYNPDENEAVVNRLLEERKQADLLPMDSIPLRGEPGLIEWKGETYDKRLRHSERFYPHRINSVGFFMARIVRRD